MTLVPPATHTHTVSCAYEKQKTRLNFEGIT